MKIFRAQNGPNDELFSNFFGHHFLPAKKLSTFQGWGFGVPKGAPRPPLAASDFIIPRDFAIPSDLATRSTPHHTVYAPPHGLSLSYIMVGHSRVAGRRSCDKVAVGGNDKVAGDLSRLPMAARVHPWVRKIPSLEKLTTFWLVQSGDQKSWKIIDRLGHSEPGIFSSKF